ncbi:hypothetical protein HPB49_024235 [Dermacentor silvarum]|uniref:Uncharacterized protein n=1 Tax=Dermacentor silvarum TaxID=543639 RepID=A0ACB8DL50_DERSI|nr:hypothetical protein HPB49_024235 [Dermacentor silvarum]
MKIQGGGCPAKPNRTRAIKASAAGRPLQPREYLPRRQANLRKKWQSTPGIEGASNDTDDNGRDWITVVRKCRCDASLPTPTTGESKVDHTQAVHITATQFDALTLGICNEQNLAVASMPKEELAERIRGISALQLGGKNYQVYAYVAAPDMSCKGVATGIDNETRPDELTHLRSPQAPILFARVLGKSTAALITFDGLEVPRTIYYYGGELLCRPYRQLSQVCSICLKTGQRADICPTPESTRCKNCAHENPSEDQQCQPKRVLCGSDHPVTHPSCPARQRKSFNKSHFLRNAGYTSDANNIPTTTNPETSTSQPQTPSSKSPPASTETSVDRGRFPRRSTDSKKTIQILGIVHIQITKPTVHQDTRHEQYEAAPSDQWAESRSPVDKLENSAMKVVTKGPGTNPPKVSEELSQEELKMLSKDGDGLNDRRAQSEPL